MKTLIEKLVLEEEISEADIRIELREICERVHFSCDDECPIYKLDTTWQPKGFWDCEYFKDGKKMFNFIKNYYESQL